MKAVTFLFRPSLAPKHAHPELCVLADGLRVLKGFLNEPLYWGEDAPTSAALLARDSTGFGDWTLPGERLFW